jgi:hypothetical protein
MKAGQNLIGNAGYDSLTPADLTPMDADDVRKYYYMLLSMVPLSTGYASCSMFMFTGELSKA